MMDTAFPRLRSRCGQGLSHRQRDRGRDHRRHMDGEAGPVALHVAFRQFCRLSQNLLYCALRVAGKRLSADDCGRVRSTTSPAQWATSRWWRSSWRCAMSVQRIPIRAAVSIALLPRYGLGGPAGWRGGSRRLGRLLHRELRHRDCPAVLLVWLLRNRIRELDERRPD